MSIQRIKGQETELTVILNGQPQRALTAIQSFEMTPMLETTSEGYLGETTERKDEIFKGVSGRFEAHMASGDIFRLEQAIIDRATRRTPGTVVNLKTTLRFPNGDRIRILIPDVKIGSPSTRAGSRADYVSKSIEFVAETYQAIG